MSYDKATTDRIQSSVTVPEISPGRTDEIGFVISLALTRFMKDLLFGVSSADPMTHAGIILIRMVAVLAA